MGPRVDERDVGVDESVETRVGIESGGCNSAFRLGHRVFESRTSNGSQETTLVAKVNIWSLVAHTDPLCYLADTELLGRLRFEQFQRGGDEPISQFSPTRRHFSRFD